MQAYGVDAKIQLALEDDVKVTMLQKSANLNTSEHP